MPTKATAQVTVACGVASGHRLGQGPQPSAGTLKHALCAGPSSAAPALARLRAKCSHVLVQSRWQKLAKGLLFPGSRHLLESPPQPSEVGLPFSTASVQKPRPGVVERPAQGHTAQRKPS